LKRKGPPRPIVVGDEEYRWIVRAADSSYPGFVVVDIFRAADRGRGQHLCVRVRFDDPWLNYGPMITTPRERFEDVWAVAPVTPALVAGWIAETRAAGWDPGVRAPAVRRVWVDGRLGPEETPATSDGR
jgi:hypothetical protein